MIYTQDDFYNKVAKDIKEKFFPTVAFYRDDKNCESAMYAVELFNNGCLTYKVFIGRLSKSCSSNNATIHNIVEKHIKSFGKYQYKPGKLYSEAKASNVTIK